MLMIRLARFGKKKQPFYRLSVAERRHSPNGKNTEYIGIYNPKSKELKIDQERAKYWLSKGAGCSRTITMLFVKEGLLKKEGLPAKYLHARTRKKKKQSESEAVPQAAASPAEQPAA